jgi:hypothetical protein
MWKRPHVTLLCCMMTALALPAAAQVDQQQAQEFFKEAQTICQRDAGRLWGMPICAPMVIGDARTRTFATSQPAPEAPPPRLIGIVNGPVRWGDRTWAALTWDTIANWPARTRGEAFLHESFHIVQPALVLNGPAGANEHLDAIDGRYWLRLEWRALARALRESGAPRTQAVREALAFRQARHTRYPDMVESERALYITEGLASYTQTVLAAPSATDAITRALELLAGAEDGESFVRTFTYTSGPAYGLLLDTAAPGWTRTVRGSDDPVVLLMRALGVQPLADTAAAALRYGGPALRTAEEQREQQRRTRIAELRQRFVDGPVFVMPCGGGGTSNSLGAVVIPAAGTVYFHPYRLSGPCSTLSAENACSRRQTAAFDVCVCLCQLTRQRLPETDGRSRLRPDGRSRRAPAPAITRSSGGHDQHVRARRTQQARLLPALGVISRIRPARPTHVFTESNTPATHCRFAPGNRRSRRRASRSR